MREEIRSYIKLLCSKKVDKIHLVNTIMQENNYEELLQFYKHTPAIHKGLFSLSYLKRTSYDNLYSSGYTIEKDIVEYVGVLAFVFERNKAYISRFLQLKTNVESAVLTGDYSKARQLIQKINSTISYSTWASELEIKIIRLADGMNASTQFYNMIYNEKRVTALFSICALKSSSIDYPFDKDIDFYNQIITQLEPQYQCFLRMHSFPYLQTDIDERWLTYDFNSSIIDLYLSLRNTLWKFPKQTIEDIRFQKYISIIEGIAMDGLLTKFCMTHGIPCSHSIDEDPIRRKILKKFLQGSYSEVIQEGYEFLNAHPTDMAILDCMVKACVLNNEHPEWLDQEACIIDKFVHNYYCLLCKDEDYGVYLNRINQICKSLYILEPCRYIYCLTNNIEQNSLGGLYDNVWQNSEMHNYIDILYFEHLCNYKVYKEYASLMPIGKTLSYNAIQLNHPEIENIITRLLPEDQVIDFLCNQWECGNVTPYLTSAVASYIFSNYVAHGNLKEAVVFYVEAYLHYKYLQIRIDNRQKLLDAIAAIQNEPSLSLDLAIFFTMIDESPGKRYLAYKHYLKQAGVSKASDLSTLNNPKIKYFLSNVADMRVLGLHALFRNPKDRQEERIKICSKLYEFSGERLYIDEITSLVKKEEVKKRINQVDDSKIFVDVESIIKNELQDEELLYKIYQETDDSIQYKDNGMQYLVDYIQSKGLKVSYYNINNIRQKYSLFQQIYIGIRDKFLYDPRYGLDFYLSTRIRHGTLINQLRNHFQEHKLVTNKTADLYENNIYWVDTMMGLKGDVRDQCIERFAYFTKTIDTCILDIKDKYVQISTENRNIDKKDAYFNFSLSATEGGIQYLYALCEGADFQTSVNHILDYLWQTVDGDLYYLREELNKIKDKMLSELSDLMSEIYHIVGDQQIVSALNNEVASCQTELQSDFDVVSKWFTRNTHTGFDFTMQSVLDTCLTNINNMNQNQLSCSIENTSTTSFAGRYFNYVYDIFHDLLNNVLNYQKKKSKIVDCNIKVYEEEELLNIIISNWIDSDDKEMIQQKMEKYKNIDDLGSLERVAKEENTGILKIYNVVANILHCTGNSYVNQVKEDCFCATITLNKKCLLYGSEGSNS